MASVLSARATAAGAMRGSARAWRTLETATRKLRADDDGEGDCGDGNLVDADGEARNWVTLSSQSKLSACGIRIDSGHKDASRRGNEVSTSMARREDHPYASSSWLDDALLPLWACEECDGDGVLDALAPIGAETGDTYECGLVP